MSAPLGPNSISSIASSKVISSLISASLMKYPDRTGTCCTRQQGRGWRLLCFFWGSRPFPAWSGSKWTGWGRKYLTCAGWPDYHLSEIYALVHTRSTTQNIILTVYLFLTSYHPQFKNKQSYVEMFGVRDRLEGGRHCFEICVLEILLFFVGGWLHLLLKVYFAGTNWWVFGEKLFFVLSL